MTNDTAPGVLFRAENATIVGDVTLEKDVSIWFGAVLRADKAAIHIGERSNIQDNAVVHTSEGHETRIGRGVSVGHGAIVHGCTIEDDVLVGMGSIVMNGTVVGRGSIIGAGAVVTGGMEIPPGSLVLGVPAKVIKKISEEQIESTKKNAESYVELARSYSNE